MSDDESWFKSAAFGDRIHSQWRHAERRDGARFEPNEVASAEAALGAGALHRLSDLKGAARYEKIDLIGEGGMGRVWLGWDRMIERNVALKEPRQGDASNRHLAARLLKEVMLTARLEHPGVVAIYDVYEERPGEPVFVMALVRGETLAKAIERASGAPEGDVEARRALTRHVLRVAEIIAHAHARGVLHRDLTPHNVIVEPEGNVRVIDWGMAVTLEQAEGAPQPAGTAGFMAPEQRRGEALDARADVWAIGALLHAVLYGRAPGEQAPRSAAAHSSAIEAICRKALSAAPSARYADALALAEEMNRWFEGRRVEAFETNPWRALSGMISRYKREVIVATWALVALAVSVSVGVYHTRFEAERARFAEHAARREQRRAELAGEEARVQAERARAHAARLQLDAAREALDRGDIGRAQQRLAEVDLSAHTRAEIIGLRMRLAMIESPTRLDPLTRALTPCLGERRLSPDPKLTLCLEQQRWLEAHRDGVSRWRVDLKEHFQRLNQSHQVKSWRVTPRGVMLRPNSAGMFHVELESGEVTALHNWAARFAAPTNAIQLEVNGERRLDALRYGESTLCSDATTHLYEHDEVTVSLCAGGAVWEKRAGQQPEKIYEGDAGRVHHYAFVAPRQERWLATSDGTIWPLGAFDRHVKLGPPIRTMFALPDSIYLVAQDWIGTWRVLDTAQGDWIASFDDNVKEIRAAPQQGALQLLYKDRVELWRLPERSVIRRYRSAYGFTDAAWSRDGEQLALTSGGARVHILKPFKGERAEPAVWGLDVMKSVTALSDKQGFLATNALLDKEQEGLTRFVLKEGQIQTIQMPLDDHWLSHARRVEMMADGTLMILTTAAALPRAVLDETGLAWRTLRDPVPLEEERFTDMSADEAGRYAAAIRRGGEIYLYAPDGTLSRRPGPKEGWRVSVATDGTYAVSTREEVLIFERSGERRHRLEAPEVTGLTWRSSHGQLITGHLDGAVRVWDALSGELLALLRQHHGRVVSLDVSPDGEHLATASWDTTARVVSFGPLD